MSDTKWADVAHYYKYVEHEVLVSHSGNREPLRRISDGGEDLSIYYRRPDLVEAGFITVPTLRHRDDMTEADAMSLWKSVRNRVEFSDSVYGAYGSPLVIYRSPSKAWHQEEFHCAIQLGYDVFGLIESGQAIRKEVGNGL